MCGIVGVLNLSTAEPIDARRLGMATDSMIHRGPNAGAIWADMNVGMGARRLSIVDLPHGHQPMTNEDGTVHLVYNGEVYNHADLRKELLGFGHRFESTCDTEVVIHAYEQWGADGCVRRLRGMFAFALWDARSQTLMLARDRMGKKPLYVAEWGGRLFFGSEIRAVLACSNMPREVNVGGLPSFLDAGFLTSPHTMFKDIRKVPPAHFLLVRRGVQSLHRYWQMSFEPDTTRSESETIERFHDLLRECVRLRLMSEVPLGALLSGGIDLLASWSECVADPRDQSPFHQTLGPQEEGFVGPVRQWLRRDPLPEWAESMLSKHALKDAGLFDPDAVARLRREHRQGTGGRGALLMGVLSLQMWRSLFIASPRLPS